MDRRVVDSMPCTERFIKEHIEANRAGDAAIVIGDREGELYRFFYAETWVAGEHAPS